MRPHALLAYDSAGAVVATLDHVVARDPDGNVTGLIDFGAHEANGGKLRDIWSVSNATGSGTWPEWLGSTAHDFTVEFDGKHIAALVHKTSGHRRERAVIEAAIALAPEVMLPDGRLAKDLRSTVGGPGKPLTLDENGRTAQRPANAGTPAHLPLIGAVNVQG